MEIKMKYRLITIEHVILILIAMIAFFNMIATDSMISATINFITGIVACKYNPKVL